MKNKAFKTVCHLAIIGMGLFFTSCDKGNEDDRMEEPEGVITLNMMNEKNGKTLLDNTALYIDSTGNFNGDRTFVIADLGELGSIGQIKDLKDIAFAKQVAVTPGHGYWVIAKATAWERPNGGKAFRVGDSYYKVYVDSLLQGNRGAKVKYLPVEIPNPGFSKPGTDLGHLHYNNSWVGDPVKADIPQTGDVQFHLYPGTESAFRPVIEADRESPETGKRYLYIDMPYELSSDYNTYPINMDLYIWQDIYFTQVSFKASNY